MRNVLILLESNQLIKITFIIQSSVITVYCCSAGLIKLASIFSQRSLAVICSLHPLPQQHTHTLNCDASGINGERDGGGMQRYNKLRIEWNLSM